MSHWWTGPLIDIAPPGRASVPNWWTGISGALIEPVDLVRALDAASPETPAGTSRTTCAHVSDLAPLRLTGRVQRARQRRIEGNRPEQFGLAHSTAGRTGSACHNDEHCVSATPDHGHSAGTNPVTSTLATSPVDPHPNSDGLASGSRRNLRRSAVRGAVSKPAPETGSSGARATATKKSRLCTRKIDSIASPAGSHQCGCEQTVTPEGREESQLHIAIDIGQAPRPWRAFAAIIDLLPRRRRHVGTMRGWRTGVDSPTGCGIARRAGDTAWRHHTRSRSRVEKSCLISWNSRHQLDAIGSAPGVPLER
jgi:hypothetical protein